MIFAQTRKRCHPRPILKHRHLYFSISLMPPNRLPRSPSSHVPLNITRAIDNEYGVFIAFKRLYPVVMRFGWSAKYLPAALEHVQI